MRFAIQGMERQFSYLLDKMSKHQSAPDEEYPIGIFRQMNNPLNLAKMLYAFVLM